MPVWFWIIVGVVGLFAMLGAALFWGAANAPSDEEMREEYEQWLKDSTEYVDGGGLDR